VAAPILQFPSSLNAEPAAILASRREVQLSRLLVAWISAGLGFMLLPGTFLGVWNLISISSRKASESVSPAWIQAHGHAQVFGWIGSFILGIGFYSLPKLLRGRPFGTWRGWVALSLWNTGVGLRWFANVSGWEWRVSVPVSAVLELAAFLIFFHSVTGHRSSRNGTRFESWIWVVAAASIGFLFTLVGNLGGALYVAAQGESAAFPHWFEQRYLVLMTWGFLVPFIWGFSARWLPVFMGLKPVWNRALLPAVALNVAGVMSALDGRLVLCTTLLLAGAVLSIVSLHIFEPTQGAPKTRGVHSSFPLFVRCAYLWMAIAAVLGIWAARSADSVGIWGASRHALTVGFFSLMVFGIGQRILPAFSGMRHLFSTKLMFASQALLTVGCALRVSSEILAYQNMFSVAWSWLPVSAVIELSAVTLFATNLLVTFARSAPPVACD
jgi:uncharacterized protein involved in response to NO